MATGSDASRRSDAELLSGGVDDRCGELAARQLEQWSVLSVGGVEADTIGEHVYADELWIRHLERLALTEEHGAGRRERELACVCDLYVGSGHDRVPAYAARVEPDAFGDPEA